MRKRVLFYDHLEGCILPAAETSIWSVLLPVLVGGGLTLLGVAIGPAITQWLSSRTATEATRIQRFEELLDLLQQQDEWLNLQRRVNAFGENREIPPEPLSKAFAVSAIYFPNFLPDLRELQTTTRIYSLWTTQAGSRRLAGKIDSINDGFDAVYSPYLKTLEATRNRITEYAVSRKGKV
jgi:hypothetical protein